jgi:hypothetical protein
MDASRFDQISRHLSRRGLTAVVMAALTAARHSGIESEAKPKDVCGGEPTSFSRYCAGVRACATDSDCAPGCACSERRAGCCYTTRRKKGRPKKRKCVELAHALFCTPR